MCTKIMALAPHTLCSFYPRVILLPLHNNIHVTLFYSKLHRFSPHFGGARTFSSSPSPLPSPSSSPSPSTQHTINEYIKRIFKKLRKSAFFLEDMKTSPPSPPPPTNATDKNTNTIDKDTNTTLININPASWEEGLRIIESDIGQMTKNITNLLIGSVLQPTHPLLAKMAAYYFELKGKRLRPVIVLLISHAVNIRDTSAKNNATKSLPTQLQLAEIVEMIHTASLVHDDVLDDSLTRRDMPSANAKYGNKMSIMAGDFLLARASISLARLQDSEVIELMASALSDLVEGEFMQMRAISEFDYYIRKTYLKTAALIANGCRSAAILSGAERSFVEIATEYGKNLGLAFQIIDDLLDFTGSPEELGKPVAVDLSLGLATAPVLYAREEFPELDSLISRKFTGDNDVIRARELILQSKGIEKTRQLAAHYTDLAIKSIMKLPQSVARDALLALPSNLLRRSR